MCLAAAPCRNEKRRTTKIGRKSSHRARLKIKCRRMKTQPHVVHETSEHALELFSRQDDTECELSCERMRTRRSLQILTRCLVNIMTLDDVRNLYYCLKKLPNTNLSERSLKLNDAIGKAKSRLLVLPHSSSTFQEPLTQFRLSLVGISRFLCELEDTAPVEMASSLLHAPVGSRAPHSSGEQNRTDHQGKASAPAQCQCGWAGETDASEGQVGGVQCAPVPGRRRGTRLQRSGSLLRSGAASRRAGRVGPPLGPDAVKLNPAGLRVAGVHLTASFLLARFTIVHCAMADVPIPPRFATAARCRAIPPLRPGRPLAIVVLLALGIA